MDAEEFKLKHRISELSDDELLKMIENHNQYRQTALDFAARELTERRIFFAPLPPKPTPVVQKKKWGWRIIALVVGLCGIGYFGWLLSDLLNHPEKTNFETVFRLMLSIVVIICVLVVRLTTYQPEDD